MKHCISTCFTVLLFLLMLPAPGRGQHMVFSEDFEYYPQINFTYPWATAGTANFPWRCDIAYIVYGLGYIDFENKTKAAITFDMGQNEDALLITPPINFGAIQNAWLSYDSYFHRLQDGGKTESATVEVSTDNGSSWNVVKSAPVSNGRHMSRSYVDLSAYNNAGSIRLGFRYSDSLKNMFGWMIDNIKVFVPAAHDIALTHAYPEDPLFSYYPAPGSVTLSGTVMNTGTNPITGFTAAYQEGSGPIQTHAVSGVNIAPFDTLRFVHSVPLSLTAIGEHKLKMWTVLASDTIHSNDTIAYKVHGAQFMPEKKLVIEEGTGTWNEQAPRGIVYMHALDTLGNPPTRIAVHAEDVMGQKDYSDYLYYMDQTFQPYFIFDRRGPVPPGEFYERYLKERNYFGFADVGISATANAGHLIVDAVIKPAVNLSGTYRVALVITEDGVKGTTSDYDQANGFALSAPGGWVYEAQMGGYENKPDPVPAAEMVYDYVARSISPTPDGLATCLPKTMTAGQSYTCRLNASYSSKWKLDKLNAVILFIRDSDSTILNSRSVPIRSLGVEETAGAGSGMQVYPNPAGASATVSFHLYARAQSSLSVTDITGRIVSQYPATWLDAGDHRLHVEVSLLPAGMYFVTLDTGNEKRTVKLSVVH